MGNGKLKLMDEFVISSIQRSTITLSIILQLSGEYVIHIILLSVDSISFSFFNVITTFSIHIAYRPQNQI